MAGSLRSVLVVLVLTMVGITVVAACCDHSHFGCCGKGKCNIFCCNCNGGCKPKSQCSRRGGLGGPPNTMSVGRIGRGKRDVVYNSTALQKFATIDLNGDERLDVDECKAFLKLSDKVLTRHPRGALAKIPEWYKEIDVDGDGFILPHEFDYSLN
ncbi:uncharacterized protein LOC129596978 [Paramacrobiotus metropolitanus]|uniref:uncharacterized protein LOC129596978 n=1 Tax=Paramacrobiotus metropolitanus TaxID=2943436 RepID=UPI002445600E|nr:uncharacterized protein LOC129596978 [Paramacrobiotus metropolitanus]